jgi:hypothetical protein
MALRKMADVCRSLEAMDVEVIRAEVDYKEMYIQVYGYKPLWAWAKLNDLEITMEPWDHLSTNYPYHTVAVSDGVTVEALMDKDDCKEAGV